MIFFFPLLLILFLLIHPVSAYAWGPATHLEYAGRALEAIGLFAPLVKKLLDRFPDHFLYGSVAADITLGKDLHGYYHNCHNWRVALDLYHHQAHKEFQKAFMLGYLGHLAVDTVSHNFFVPFKMIRSWRAAMFNHVYWEMRMDLTVPDKYWELFEGVKKKDFREDDLLLDKHLKKTFFSFRTNKRIFNSLILLQRMKNYRRVLHAVTRKSALSLAEEDVRNYKRLAVRAVIDFLKNPEEAMALRADPTGTVKMLYAKEIVREIKRARKSGDLTTEIEKRMLKDIKHNLETSLYAFAPPPPTLADYLPK